MTKQVGIHHVKTSENYPNLSLQNLIMTSPLSLYGRRPSWYLIPIAICVAAVLYEWCHLDSAVIELTVHYAHVWSGNASDGYSEGTAWHSEVSERKRNKPYNKRPLREKTTNIRKSKNQKDLASEHVREEERSEDVESHTVHPYDFNFLEDPDWQEFTSGSSDTEGRFFNDPFPVPDDPTQYESPDEFDDEEFWRAWDEQNSYHDEPEPEESVIYEPGDEILVEAEEEYIRLYEELFGGTVPDGTHESTVHSDEKQLMEEEEETDRGVDSGYPKEVFSNHEMDSNRKDNGRTRTDSKTEKEQRKGPVIYGLHKYEQVDSLCDLNYVQLYHELARKD